MGHEYLFVSRAPNESMRIMSQSVRYSLCVLLLITACFLSGCISDDGNLAARAPEPPIVTDLIIIGKMTFNPDMMVITPGTTVTWINEDSVPHTVVSDPGSDLSFSSPELKRDDTFSFTFEKRGTYLYHCTLHPEMTGSIIVQT